MAAKLTEAVAVSMAKMTDCGPGHWWFVHHPEGFLIEIGHEEVAKALAAEINAGRSQHQGGGRGHE